MPNAIEKTTVLSDIEKVQGFFLIEDISYVQKVKGPEGVAALQKLVPSLNFNTISAIKKYPLTLELEMLHAMTIVLYGNDSPESWFELGRHDLETCVNSNLGKVILALIGPKYTELIKHGGRILTAFAPFVRYKFLKLSDTECKITIENDPYPIEYYRGSLSAIKDMVKTEATITATDLGNKTHLYHVQAAGTQQKNM